MNENSILISYYHVGVINHKLHCLNSASYCILQNDEAALLEGEKEAEMMIVEAYAALLLAFLSTERCLFFLSFLFFSPFGLNLLKLIIFLYLYILTA